MLRACVFVYFKFVVRVCIVQSTRTSMYKCIKSSAYLKFYMLHLYNGEYSQYKMNGDIEPSLFIANLNGTLRTNQATC